MTTDFSEFAKAPHPERPNGLRIIGSAPSSARAELVRGLLVIAEDEVYSALPSEVKETCREAATALSAREREIYEECAKLCDARKELYDDCAAKTETREEYDHYAEKAAVAWQCAEAIRAAGRRT